MKIQYTLRRSKRARKIRLTVNPDGSVVVTSPYGVPSYISERFVRDKADWILSKISFFNKDKRIKRTRKDYLKHKESARQLVKERLDYFSNRYNFVFNKVSIRDQKTRWGSCSRKGNLNFNYRVVFLNNHIADYIFAHELCHLKEFNHSKNFWKTVSEIVPNYINIKKELKKIRLG